MTQIHKYLILVSLFLGIHFALHGQTKLFTNDELPSEHIYQITQDEAGFIWILTEDGMAKYNGNHVKIFTTKDGLPTNAIYSSQVTGNKLWFMCNGDQQGYIRNDSVFSFKYHEGSFTYSNFTVRENEVLFNDLEDNQCGVRNNKWMVIEKNRIAHGKTPLFCESLNYYELSEDEQFFYRNDSSLFSIPYDNSANFHIVQYFPNNLIAITTKDDIFFVETESLKVTKVMLPHKTHQALHGSSLRYVNGQFQVSYMDFVGVLDDNFQLKESYEIDPELKAHANFIDKENNIWIGSFESGLHYLSPKERIAKIERSANATHGPICFENETYYLTNKSLFQFGNKDSLFHSDYYIYSASQVDDELWFPHNSITLNDSQVSFNQSLTDDKIGFLPKTIRKFRNKYFGIDHKRVVVFSSEFKRLSSSYFTANDLAVFQDTVFILANDGLYYLNKNNSIVKHTVGIDVQLRCHGVVNDALLLGTESGGLIKYSKGKAETIPLQEATINGISTFNDSIVFCATDVGLICLEKRNKTYHPYYNYTKADGLGSNVATGVATDHKSIYITTNKGITKTKVVFPGQKETKLNPLYIASIHLNDSLLKTQDTLQLKFGTANTLSIDFDCIHYDYKPSLKYAYKLMRDGAGDWVETSTGNVSFTDLPIGEYAIYLKTEKAFVASAQKIIFLKIQARWFETLAFKIIIVLSLLLLFALGLKDWFKKKNKKELSALRKEAEKSNFQLAALRSQMNPHFVFNSLNAIQYYINENENELSEKYLLKFAKLIREFFDLSSEKNISLEREVQLLNNYLSLEQMRFEDKLSFIISVDEKLNTKQVKIPSMLIQPIVENAVNHGIFHKEEAGTVSVEFKYISSLAYQVIITDDGIGLNNSKVLKQKSMQGHVSKSSIIFKERIDLLNKTEKWKIDFHTSILRKHSKYPGTIVAINIKLND